MTYETLSPLGQLPPEKNPAYKKRQRNNLTRIGLALLAFLLLNTFVQAAYMITVQVLFPSFYNTEIYDWILNIVPTYLVGFPFFYFFLAQMPKKVPEKKPLGKENLVALVCISFLLMMAGNLIAVILMNTFELLRGAETSNVVENYIDQYSPLLSFVTMVLLAPVIEEWMFRKLLIDRLLPYSEKLAVVTGGLLFGLVHGNFYQFFYAAMLGILFGYVYVKTGKLRYTIAMHMIVNFTGTTISTFLTEVTSENAMLSSSINPWIAVAGIYSMAMYILAGCGIFFLIRKRREITLSGIGERYLTLGTQFRLTWINAGTIAFCVISGLSFLMSLFI